MIGHAQADTEIGGNVSEPVRDRGRLSCHFEGCNAGPYNRPADLRRHRLKHSASYRFKCPAQDCKFKGSRGFLRPDKLREHILAGHTEDDTFESWVSVVTRDCLSLQTDSMFHGLQKYRTCPMPRCQFKVNAAHASMDLLQQHLLQKHDAQGRANFAQLLLRRGYDHATSRVVCPVCADMTLFNTHADFYWHFLTTHKFNNDTCWECGGLDHSICWFAAGPGWWSCRQYPTENVTLNDWRHANLSSSRAYGNLEIERLFELPATSGIERAPGLEHMRTLLRLWPDFKFHPLTTAYMTYLRKNGKAYVTSS